MEYTYTREIDEENHVILHYTVDNKYCFVERRDGIFLIYEKSGDHSYRFLETKLTSLSDCNRWLEAHNYNPYLESVIKGFESVDFWNEILTPERRNEILNMIAATYDPLDIYGREGMVKWLKDHKFRNIDKHI